MLESNLCLEFPRRTLIQCTFELGLEPSLLLQWSFWDCIYDIYVWKNTQLGPLLIYFKRREAHKSSGRAECSQKAVDVWIASTASSPASVFSPWLASVKSLATGMLQDHLQMEYQKDSFSCFQTPQFFLHGHLVYLLPAWTKSRAWKAPQQS